MAQSLRQGLSFSSRPADSPTESDATTRPPPKTALYDLLLRIPVSSLTSSAALSRRTSPTPQDLSREGLLIIKFKKSWRDAQ
ncbi:hypothetical protein FRC07_007535, partial [Ceratobasidium sp. 392]